MIWRGVFLLTVLSTCVLSLPVTSSQLENEDVEVMKCVVEALADVLSRPHLMPISQECLVTLKTDNRLLTILRHHNFLKELQEIVVQGGHRRDVLQRYADSPTPTTKTLHTLDCVADRSMLDALGGPGERSILSHRKRDGDRREEEDESSEERESQEDSGAEVVEAKRRKEEANNHGEGGHKKKRTNSEENSKEENKVKDTRGDGFDEKSSTSRNKPTKGSLEVEDKEESGKRSALLSQKLDSKEEEDKMKRGGKENIKRWTKRTKSSHLKKKTVQKEEQQFSSQQEVPHHSKEVADEKEEEERGVQKSPEETELHLIVNGAHEEKRGMEDEGSGIRKEEPEIESLAAIESELENVAQKLHDLRRG